MLIAIGLDGGGRKAIQVGEYPSTAVQCWVASEPEQWKISQK